MPQTQAWGLPTNCKNMWGVFQLEEKLDQLDLIEVKSGNKIEVWIKKKKKFCQLNILNRVHVVLAKAFLITLLHLRKSCATLYRTLWSLIEPQWGSTKSDNCNDTLSYSAALSCSSQAAGMWLVVLLHANFIYKSCGKNKHFYNLFFTTRIRIHLLMLQ